MRLMITVLVDHGCSAQWSSADQHVVAGCRFTLRYQVDTSTQCRALLNQSTLVNAFK
jgi:hypothetical protein